MQFLKKEIILFTLFILSFTAFSSDYHRVKIHLDNQTIQQLLSTGISSEFGAYKRGVFVTGEYSDEELQLINAAGFRYEVLIEDMEQYYVSRNAKFDVQQINNSLGTKNNGSNYETPENFFLGSMGGFHTYDEILDDLDAMHALFPDLISEKQMVDESITTIEGRPVYFARISNNPGQVQEKPRILYTSLTHAREPASMQQMLFQMWYILENYDNDPEIQYLVDNTEIYFIPCVNPDGYVYCEMTHPNGGSMHRKNKRINSDGSVGVDLNRNYGYQWGYDNSGSSPSPSSQTYRGTEAFSEPETQIQKQFAEDMNFNLALNNHTYSDLLIYPWGYDNILTPDSTTFSTYAKYLTKENGYAYGTVYQTLNYYANGGADDWYYGEQDTKDKVISFTPEAGAPSDGFWPSMDRIESICAGHTHMNLGLARLALPYAKITDLTEPYISQTKSDDFVFQIQSIGYYENASFSVKLQPLSDNISSVGQPVYFENMDIMQKDNGLINITLNQNLQTGEMIRFLVETDNGQFVRQDTITKFYGDLEVFFTDLGDNLNNWETSEWNVTNSEFFSASSSITDSPNSEYSNDSNTLIDISEPLDLSNFAMGWIEFYTMYDIEKNWDFVQLQYSIDNKITWHALQGELTEEGNINQDQGEPIYHGSLNYWTKEKVDISHIAGNEQVWLRFRLVSDGLITADGFYFDDFTIKFIPLESEMEINLPEKISMYQHQDTLINLPVYANWELDENTVFVLDNSEHFSMEMNEQHQLVIDNIDDQYTGTETVNITFTQQQTSISKNLQLESMPVPPPVIISQQEIQINQGDSLQFDPQMLVVEDDFFIFPDEFTWNIAEGLFHTLEENDWIIFNPGFSGILSIPLSVSNGFKESGSYYFKIDITAPTHIKETIEGLNIFYSQTNGLLTILHHNSSFSEQLIIQVLDISGTLLKTYTTDKTFEKQIIDLNHLETGIYIINCKNQSKTLNTIKIRTK